MARSKSTPKRRSASAAPQTVDAAFLREIEGWRSTLARDFAAGNDLNRRQLNYAVQMTIDRIIFLRMCRGPRHRGLRPAARHSPTGDGVYGRLRRTVSARPTTATTPASSISAPREGRDGEPDELTPSPGRSTTSSLKEIIRGLYYPESPYEFTVLPGRDAGAGLRAVPGQGDPPDGRPRAAVEEKPEVRKAGGVYYTPTYIVDYIVENTVGKLLEGKRPGPSGGASRLKILDPACGSGSFLIGAYQYLLDWHRDRYVEDGPEKHPQGALPGAGRPVAPDHR